MKIRVENVIDVQVWDDIVTKTYKRPYSFQQQDGCKDRGMFSITVPDYGEDYENDTVPEVVNHDDRGVSFAAWLARNPIQPLTGEGDGDIFSLGLWWDRNFYPNVQMIANDLHAKGLLDVGNYMINIDW